MANEISIALGQTGLSVIARLYLDGILDINIVSLNEVSGAGGLYIGDMPSVSAGIYQVMFYADGSLRGSGNIEWDGLAEVTVGSRLSTVDYETSASDITDILDESLAILNVLNSVVPTMSGQVGHLYAGFTDEIFEWLEHLEWYTQERAELIDNLYFYSEARAELIDRLDATITSRLAAADYLPGDTDEGVQTLLDRLTEIRAGYLDRLNGSSIIEIIAPLDPTSFALTLKRGDSYTDAIGRALIYEDDGGNWPDLSTATIEFSIGVTSTEAEVLSIEAELVNTTRIKVEITSAQTAELTVSRSVYTYDLRATIGDEVFTLCTGSIHVLAAIR